MIGIYITYEESSVIQKIEIKLIELGFSVMSDGLYICEKEGLLNTYVFMEWLKSEINLTKSITKIHVFRLDSLSDFTNFVKNI